MKEAVLVFIPFPIIGHLVSTVEFARRLIRQDDRISVTVLSLNPPLSFSLDAYSKSISALEPSICFVDLPPVDLPSSDQPDVAPEALAYYYIESQMPHVKNFMASFPVSGPSRVVGLVLDFFCAPMIDVGNELDLPSYMFFTSNAGFLGLMLHLPTRHEQNSAEFERTDPESLIPGFVSPVPVSVLPVCLFNKFAGYIALVKLAQRFKDTKGIIVNTFEELELNAVRYFTNSQIHGQNPPIYPVGPVLDLNRKPNPDINVAQSDKVIEWLNDQPQASVVFLCFGSFGNFGSFEAPQAREIAVALEQSGYRFLWSLRLSQPRDNDPSGNTQYKNPEDVLPEGFLERIEGRGMVCGWAPQVEVLAHKAIGGFVSHCGWNSILESLWFGVPIVTWPLYAEQQLNAFEMVKELGLAVEMRLDYSINSGLVEAEEIEKALHGVMDGGSEVRKKVKAMSDMAKNAIKDGGSSFLSIARFIGDMMGKTADI
ncbi:hypothetical protein SLA2020_328300 [Shorea laevis]